MLSRCRARLGLIILVTASTSNADMGFTPLDSSKVPQAVKIAGGKVLEIWTPMITKTYPKSEYSRLLRGYGKSDSSDTRVQMTVRLAKTELLHCIQIGKSECQLTRIPGRGSAIIVNRNLLVTVSHNFQLGSMGRSPIGDGLFILTNAHGEVVFDSGQAGFQVLRFRGFHISQQQQLPTLAADQLLDSAVIRLADDLPDLTVAQHCALGSTAFAVGFPSASNSRAPFGARDPNDRELSVTAGRVLTPAQATYQGQGWRKIKNWVDALNGFPFMFTSADSTPGMSGGPILNENGEVCGTLQGLLPGSEMFDLDPITKAPLFLSYGLTMKGQLNEIH